MSGEGIGAGPSADQLDEGLLDDEMREVAHELVDSVRSVLRGIDALIDDPERIQTSIESFAGRARQAYDSVRAHAASGGHHADRRGTDGPGQT